MVAILLSAAAFGALVWMSPGLPVVARERLDAFESRLRRRGPWIAAAVSIVVIWFVWDALVPVPKVHDENSYLLQADIFARGRWTVPSPPIPEFFEQPHVLVVPAVASKYPPGHALLLTLGALTHFPPLVPLLLTGIAAALIFALATRVTNAWIGPTTWLIWLSAPIVLRFQPSYFSELTTSVAILGSWWSLLEWRETRRHHWLLLLALAVGWGAITRPLTMLAFAMPIGFVVIRDVVRLRLWADFALAVVVGVLILAILPLWSARTTGDWRLTPLELYRRDYLPFDKIGFTPDTTPPRRAVSPVLKTTYNYFLSARKQQTLGTLPQTAGDRLVQLVIALFQGSRLPLLLFALVGLLYRNTAIRFAALSCVIVFVAHLPYAHWAPWTIYYLETTPVVSLLAAVGLWSVLTRVAKDDARVRVAMLVAVGVIAAFAIPAIGHWKRDHRGRSRFDRRFAAELKRLPQHSIVFVQYSPRVSQHIAEVFNYADLDAAPIWVVHDLGARNAELRAKAPDRSSFDFEEDQLVQRLKR